MGPFSEGPKDLAHRTSELEFLETCRLGLFPQLFKKLTKSEQRSFSLVIYGYGTVKRSLECLPSLESLTFDVCVLIERCKRQHIF